MSLLDTEFAEGRQWPRLGDAYEITKKPRGLDMASLPAVPFVPMDAIPQGGTYAPDYTLRQPSEIRSGTYFERGDVLVAKITPSFENGKQALVTGLPTPFGIATTEVIPLRPRKEGQDTRLLFFYLLHPDIRHHVAERMEGATGRQRIPQDVILDLPFPEFKPEEQTAISDSLEMIQRLRVVEMQSMQKAQALKRATMHTLFTRGLRGEARKETEIGPLPESWHIGQLGEFADVISTRMSYSELDHAEHAGTGDTVIVQGIKVSDMNLPGNELELQTAALERMVGKDEAEYRCAPPGTIIFPKRGAAIATNKKRISTRWTAFDPNVIGVASTGNIEQTFLFDWFQMFDLRTITELGPTPQLNKKNLLPLSIPIPPTQEEQLEIVAILDAIDGKIDLHRRKRAVLEELFKALLHKLMTGEIRVGVRELHLEEKSDGATTGIVQPEPIGEHL